MTDSPGIRPPLAQDSSNLNLPDSRATASPSDVQVTLTLPAAIVATLRQASQEPLDQQIMDLLQRAMGCRLESHQLQADVRQTPLSSIDPFLQQEVERLKQRISLLEDLLPRVEAIEGKSIAF